MIPVYSRCLVTSLGSVTTALWAVSTVAFDFNILRNRLGLRDIVASLGSVPTALWAVSTVAFDFDLLRNRLGLGDIVASLQAVTTTLRAVSAVALNLNGLRVFDRLMSRLGLGTSACTDTMTAAVLMIRLWHGKLRLRDLVTSL